MTLPNLFEKLAEVLTITRSDPKAACRPCIESAHPLQLRRSRTTGTAF